VSIRYVAAVLDRLTHLKPAEKLVLVALADFASDDTRECWPSVATIMRRSGLSRRGVQQILRRLEAAKLLETAVGGNKIAANTPNCYRLKFTYDGDRLEVVEPKLSTRAHGVRATPTQGRTACAVRAHGATDKGARRAPDPLLIRHRTKERLKNASDEKSRQKGAQSLRELLEQLNERKGKDPKP
jgi:hypothetical protein